MRKTLITTLLTISLLPAFGQDITKKQQQAINDFTDCIKQQNKEKLASRVAYPLRRQYPIPSVKNRQEFVKRYDEIIDANLTKMIISSNPDSDWSAVGWRGIMWNGGDLWLNYDGKLIAVNYQSEAEAKKRDELIKAEKAQLHPSLRDFKNPILIMETAKYRIRIDEMENGYRYASWKLAGNMRDKPDLVLQDGEYVPDGTMGNHSYVFKNGDFKYDCAIDEMREKNSPPAYLTIYKGDKQIGYQKANMLKK